ncbi:hypothetical protein [Ferruginibacter albus]|uniref:hypothetical protein n=1 Tax=Ferruginibacter albus TaxID=2875540 RepID=UPI001CC458CB|nr:hypothetical protein [Ferruginibacter albus]UAY52221.1 hypothetical protein K9M53_00670 [Ferruginibacter albus]
MSNIKWIFLPSDQYDTALAQNEYSAGYFLNEGNFFVIRTVAVFSFFSFGSYLIINLFFAMLAFSGVWQLFKFFYEQYPHLHKSLAIAILFLPSPVFWTSGILKDPICLAMMGWLTYSLYWLLIKRKGIIKNILVAFISGWVLFTVKAYILFSYLPFFILFIVMRYIGKIKTTFFKIIIGAFVLVFIVGVLAGIYSQLGDQMGTFAIDNLTEAVQTQQVNYKNMEDLAESSFSLGVEFDGSASSFIKTFPAAITATFYRPFLWESKKISTLISSFESLAMMLLLLYTLFKTKVVFFFKYIFTDPMVLFCFSFSFLFAFFVGVTTLNFGTLVRYKVPCLPFYIIGLMVILDNYNKRKTASKEAA